MTSFAEDIDWYPLPEVVDNNHTHTPLPSHSTNISSSITVDKKTNHGQTPQNLSIFSVSNSSTSRYTPTSSTIPQFQATPTKLDQLWKQFLATTFISKPHPPSNAEIFQDRKCQCTCHYKSHSTPSDHHPHFKTKEKTTPTKTLHFIVSPPPSPKKLAPPNAVQFKATPTIRTPSPFNQERMEKLSLQDACTIFKKTFIQNSQKRQEDLKLRQRCQPLNPQVIQSIDTHNKRGKSDKEVPTFIPCVSSRPPIPYKAMYKHSKKIWDSLPEVKAREKEEMKRKEAATNRLRVKIYQKEVLARMRRLRTRNNRQTYY